MTQTVCSRCVYRGEGDYVQCEKCRTHDRHRNAIEDAQAKADHYREDRDRWIRLFNRLEAAISHHCEAKGDYIDMDDEALFAARARVLSDASNASR